MTFRIQATHFSLTYPQANLENDELLQFLAGIKGVTKVVVCREHHQDGNPHSHAYIKFKTRKDIKNETFFNFKDHHPNIQKTTNVPAWIQYIKKDGNHSEWNTDNENPVDIFELSKTLDEENFFRQCLDSRIPYQYAKHAWDLNIRNMNSNTYNVDSEICGTITCMMLQTTIFVQDSKSLWIVGPSGIGKTTWALKNAPKPCLFVTHMDTLRQFLPSVHKSIIFDDMSFLHIPRDGQIHIVDQYHPRTIHVRYTTVNIPAGTPKIFLSNTEIFLKDQAIERRIHKIDCRNHQ